jgi:hypothetical protein
MTPLEWVDFVKAQPRKPNENSATLLRRHYPFQYQLIAPRVKDEAQAWLAAQCQSDDFVHLINVYAFRDELIAMQFKLTFSDNVVKNT